jgi:hypothetical protein
MIPLNNAAIPDPGGLSGIIDETHRLFDYA